MKTCYSVSPDALFGWSERTQTDWRTMRRDGPYDRYTWQAFAASTIQKYPTKYPAFGPLYACPFLEQVFRRHVKGRAAEPAECVRLSSLIWRSA